MRNQDKGTIGEQLAIETLNEEYSIIYKSVTNTGIPAADLIASNDNEKLLINVKTGNNAYNVTRTNLERLLLIQKMEGGTPSLLFCSNDKMFLFSLKQVYSNNEKIKKKFSTMNMMPFKGVHVAPEGFVRWLIQETSVGMNIPEVKKVE